ncbi:TetR family transcriptional regulator [Herbihabitans rhizosphaerae]|uniref:TetR family transcriptional regulator n=1 Tax=Herbihabitans rhizosphaerae TaxID=1872711 RepID=A0A4V2EU66_9PSEU|nr:TetR/AcrR family transcriptional regulator [Herbihabitans rhizosphaerae]RZS43503.1 TetR family transcriptional regulator [Herbihabitans rhizosphaerae]
MSTSGGERVWGGTTLAERRATRRIALLDAALELVGEQGGAGVTVRSVCRKAGLTDRYFYENFAGRDELLAALFLGVADEIQEALKTSVAEAGEDLERQARAAVQSFAAICLDDPRKGRLVLVEPMADQALAGVTISSVPMFTRMVRAQLPGHPTRQQASMTAIGLTGAVAALFSSWMTGTLHVSREELIDHCVDTILLYWQAK